MSSKLMFVVLGLLSQLRGISSGFDGQLGESDVFENPVCQGGILERNACECGKFNAECVSSSCQICKCRKKTRIYRSDVRKCLTDIEARDPWCRYQFVNTRADIIPTINLSKKCLSPSNKCSKPINAPLDKTKHTCRFSWVNFLENGTWHEKSVTQFKDTFQLHESDYFSNGGHMYSLEWKGSKQSHVRKQLFQVSLECKDRDNMKESYCLMFRIRGKNNPILYSGAEVRQKTAQTPTSEAQTIFNFEGAIPTDKPTRVRNVHEREDTEKAKIVVVKDNFVIILAAIAGALGTAIIVIPIALFCHRTSRRRGSMAVRTRSTQNEQPSTSFEEERDFEEMEPQTSEETLSSYASLSPNREPPPIYQPLNRGYDTPDEEPIYICVDGEEEEEVAVKPPPIYHVLEDLRQEEQSGLDPQETNNES